MTSMIPTCLPIAELNALDRFQGVQDGVNTPASQWWLWVGIALLTIATAAVAYWVVRRQLLLRKLAFWRRFNDKSESLGLSDEERSLLTRVVEALDLADPEAVFTSEQVFYEGIAKLQGRPESGCDPNVCGTCVYLCSLRDKLGFHPKPPSTKPTNIDLGMLERGTRFELALSEAPEGVEATVVSCSQHEFTVAGPDWMHPRIGERMLVKYPMGGMLWEFDAWVVRLGEEHSFTLKPDGPLRTINRRRFPRIPTKRRAYLAVFPFRKFDTRADTPEFHAALLAEVAGPGLLLRAKINPRVGQKMLVVVERAEGESFESVALVRRVEPFAESMFTLALEMIGLTTAEVADLTKFTNHTAQENEQTRRKQRERDREPSDAQRALPDPKATPNSSEATP